VDRIDDSQNFLGIHSNLSATYFARSGGKSSFSNCSYYSSR
jgi:hypothetical protein